MSNIFFTSFDGIVWVNKSYIKELIKKYSGTKNLASALNTHLDLMFQVEPDKIPQNSDVDYFYCGNCRKGFPVRYTSEMVVSDHRPCPSCGAQSRKTPKLGDQK